MTLLVEFEKDVDDIHEYYIDVIYTFIITRIFFLILLTSFHFIFFYLFCII